MENENRLKILLHNAISLLADKTIGPDDSFDDWLEYLCVELGTSTAELSRFEINFNEML